MPRDHLDDAQTLLQTGRFDVKQLVHHDDDGSVHQRQVVAPADAVVVLPLLDAQTVVLIRNRRLAVGQTLWELPAGTVEPGEDHDRTAARELTEETGYVADQVRRLTAFYPTPGFVTEKLSAYLATGLTLAEQDLDDGERIEVHPTPLETAWAMCRDGTIQDAKTLVLLLWHKAFGG
jgi:ADP-ribose pyrophosphatase